MTDPRDFTVERHVGDDGRAVVTASGDLDYGSYARLEAELVDAVDEGPDMVVVDLSAVTYCDSCGLRVLLGAAQRQRRGGGEFTLRNATGQPQRALRLTGLDLVLGGSGPDTATADGAAVQA